LQERGVKIEFDKADPASYAAFLRVKRLPTYRVVGRVAEFPDEYAALMDVHSPDETSAVEHRPWPGLFDYQESIAAMAIRKRKFAVFADPGLGKTFIASEFARAAVDHLPADRSVLTVAPLMVVRQTVAEIERFYGGSIPIEVVKAADLPRWCESPTSRIGITNYDALTADVPRGRLGALILDESSMLKSAYGKWAGECIRLGKGLEWKLALTGTPAPNDRIEFANHAVFLDAFPTVNSFLARFFVNRGQTDNRWEMKPHAVGPFYRALSHWSIFLTDPATYGWKDNAGTIPPIHVHIDDVDLTAEQSSAVRSATGRFFGGNPGGITGRSKFAQLAKGRHEGRDVATLKPAFIKALVDSWPDESTIIWCHFNAEQEGMAKVFPDAANIDGSTPMERRESLIEEFKAGRRKMLISKPRVLGFGLNLQVATRQIFSGLQDSYEEFYQAVKRSNRVGSTRPLNVHIPVTEIERPMIQTVLAKAARVQADAEAQEAMFREHSA